MVYTHIIYEIEYTLDQIPGEYGVIIAIISSDHEDHAISIFSGAVIDYIKTRFPSRKIELTANDINVDLVSISTIANDVILKSPVIFFTDYIE